MNKWHWFYGCRYELSGDNIGLLKYFTRTNYYHIHSDELTSLQRWKVRALKKLKGKVRFCI